MTWPRLAARFAFWRDEPPPAVLLQYPAAFLGWEPTTTTTGDAMEVLSALFPGGKL